MSAEAKATKDKTKVAAVTDALAKMAGIDINQITLNDVGPTWGHDITQKAERALIIFLVAVVIYITFRFEGKMAIAALLALIHDILVTVGIYAISGFQVSPATVIAFLTILGYSLYDTIVVFDKIEENTKGLASTGRITYTETVNLSMNQVLMRSINTSLVAIMPILSILVIGSFLPRRRLVAGLRAGPVHRPADRGLLLDLHRLAHPGRHEGARAALQPDPPAAGQPGIDDRCADPGRGCGRRR